MRYIVGSYHVVDSRSDQSVLRSRYIPLHITLHTRSISGQRWFLLGYITSYIELQIDQIISSSWSMVVKLNIGLTSHSITTVTGWSYSKHEELFLTVRELFIRLFSDICIGFPLPQCHKKNACDKPLIYITNIGFHVRFYCDEIYAKKL